MSRCPTAGIREDVKFGSAATGHAQATGLHVLRSGSKQLTLHASERRDENRFLVDGIQVC